MPVMNGYDATVQIRNFEQKEGLQHTPIVALTATDNVSIKEQCLSFGMYAQQRAHTKHTKHTKHTHSLFSLFWVFLILCFYNNQWINVSLKFDKTFYFCSFV
jgi:CheY-like chemotaxis protein